jgi:hypothetical protein
LVVHGTFFVRWSLDRMRGQQTRTSVGRRHRTTRAGTAGRRRQLLPQRGLLAHRQSSAGYWVRRARRRSLCRAVGH